MKKHYTIPFFIPHQGCPFTCIFCSQKKISGRSGSFPPSKIPFTIKKYLKTIPKKNTAIEAAFFGGSFTGLSTKKIRAYLEAIKPFIKKKLISGIRISTRPDYIDIEVLSLLKEYNVNSVELGVQSMDNSVLNASHRGHTFHDIEKASELIIKCGFTLGHQIMVGLPKSSLKKETDSALKSILMGAREVRIYPVVVIKGTALAKLAEKGLYKALSENDAIKRSAKLVEIFRKNNVRVLRCGLHPSEGLITGKEILAGPFHEAFGQKVESYLYKDMIKKFLKKEKTPNLISKIIFNPKNGASVIGHKRENAEYFERILKKPKLFFGSDKVPEESLRLEYSNGKQKLIGRL